MSTTSSGFFFLVSNPSQTHQPSIIACAVLTWVIGAVFVGLRFYTRRVVLRSALGVEDWLIAVALVFSAATSAGSIEREFSRPHSRSGILTPRDRGGLRPGKTLPGH
jgi:hypothetical protein